MFFPLYVTIFLYSSRYFRLVSALTGALGDIGGRNDFASAIYARCLVCDKPVKSLVPSMLAPLSNNRNTRAFSPDRGSINQLSAGGGFFLDKNIDRGLGPFDRPSSMGLLNGSGGSGSMGFAAWGSSQSSPLSLNLNSQTLPYGTALTTHSGIIQGRSRANSAYDTMTLNQTSLDLPPLQVQSKCI